MVSLNDFLRLEFVDCLENSAMVTLTVIDSRYKPIHIEVVHIALSSVIDQVLGRDYWQNLEGELKTSSVHILSTTWVCDKVLNPVKTKQKHSPSRKMLNILVFGFKITTSCESIFSAYWRSCWLLIWHWTAKGRPIQLIWFKSKILSFQTMSACADGPD